MLGHCAGPLTCFKSWFPCFFLWRVFQLSVHWCLPPNLLPYTACSGLLFVFLFVLCNDLVAKVLTSNAVGSSMGTVFNPGGPASHPAPCLWSRKTVEDSLKLWDPAPMWKTWMMCMAPGFRLAQFWPLQSLEEWIIRWKIVLLSLLLSICEILQ